MKKNNTSGTGKVSQVRGYRLIKTDFVEACQYKPYTSDMQKEDNRTYLFMMIILAIILIVFLSINAKQNQEIKAFESMQVSAAVTVPVKAAPIVTPPKTEISTQTFEVFTITAYCSCSKCCGKSDGITYSGQKAVEGITIAADLNILPIGTVVEIEGIGKRTVQDKGGNIKGNRIDLFMGTDHQKALNFGKQERWVTVIKEGS
jgi:3D (Asp-Asp-Asp) domain-containing protein